jgi:hypothetical protein
MENLMDDEHLHYCRKARKGKVLSANLLGEGGVWVRMADRDCCLPAEFGRKSAHFQSPNAPRLRLNS